MTDEEYREQVQQRWRETMALLGFDDPGPAPPAEPEKPASAQTLEVEVRHPEGPQNVEPKSPPAAAQPLGIYREDRDSDKPERQTDETVPAQLDSSGLSEAGAEPSEDMLPPAGEESWEEKQGRRRRGRRGRRGKKMESGDAAGQGEGPIAKEASSAEEDSGEKEAGGSRRGRGRSRQRPAKPVLTPAADQDEQATDAAVDSNDFGDDEPTNPSEWDVPSWQDLIASLYRPER